MGAVRRRLSRPVLLALLIVVAPVVTLMVLFHLYTGPWSANTRQAAIEQDVHASLPIGTSRQEVEAYFARKNYIYFYQPRWHAVVGGIQKFSFGLLSHSTLRITVWLDAEERVRLIEVERLITAV